MRVSSPCLRSSDSRVELVTGAADGKDYPRVRLVVLEFLAEVHDVIVDSARGGHVLRRVDPVLAEQVCAADDLAALAPEVLENLKFARGHFERRAVLRRFVFLEVQVNPLDRKSVV